MSFCILFILFTGSGYITTDCYVDGVYITPHDVVRVSRIPLSYRWDTFVAPQEYSSYYAPTARTVRWDTYIYGDYAPVYVYPRYRGYRWGFWQPRGYGSKFSHRGRYAKPRRHYKNYKPIKYKKHRPKRTYRKKNYRRNKRRFK